MRAPAPSGDRAGWRPLALLIAGGLLAVFGFQASLLSVSRQRAIDLIAVRAANRAQANANQIAGIFKQIDLILLDLRDQLDPEEIARGQQAADPARTAEVGGRFRERIVRMPRLVAVSAFAADGGCVYSSRDPVPGINVADRAYFQELRASGDDRMLISPPILGRVSQRYGITCARRLHGRDGAFAGAVVVGIDAHGLAADMQAVDLRSWTLALVHRDGLLATRQPAVAERVGHAVDAAAAAWLAGPMPSHRGAILDEADSHIWGRAEVDGLPLTVVAGFPETLALEQWRQDLHAHLVAAALLTAGGIAVLVLHARRERSLAAAAELDRRLRASERSLIELVQRIPVGVFAVRAGDEPTAAYASQRCLDILAPVPAEPGALLAAVHPEDRAALDAALAAADGEDGFVWSGRIRAGDAVRWLDVRANRTEDGLWNGVVDDVTARREAQAELVRQEELLLAVFANAPVGICLVDPEKRVIASANPAACAIHGRSPEAMTGADPFTFTHPDDVERARAAVMRARVPGAPPQRVEVRAITGDGRTIDLDLLVTTIRDPQGRPVHGLALFRDITEEKRLGLQLRQSEKMQAVGLLAGGIAHDFNNILGGISGFADLARRQQPAEPVAAHLAQIAAAAERARTLVQQILAFSRRSPGERTPVRLQSIVREVLELLRATLPSSVEMTASLDPAVGTVSADPGRIHQAVMNLCSNAVHAMGGKGRLRVMLDQVACAVAPRGRLGGLPPGTYARLSVADTGCGMDEPTLQRMFEPFFTTKGPHEGTGLGLAVVWGVVEAHGGDILVESAPGKGTTFAILLPVIAQEAPPTPDDAPATVPRGAESILVVDDEPALRTIFEEFLAQLGYRVRACRDGAEAIAVLRADPGAVDLLITDQTMPVMTGAELVEAVRLLHPDLPVIVCSGHDCPAEGPDDPRRQSCLKPVNLATLARMVRRGLDAPPT